MGGTPGRIKQRLLIHIGGVNRDGTAELFLNFINNVTHSTNFYR